MKTKLLSVFLLLALTFGALAPVTTAQAAQMVGAPAWLQFTAGGHALGFASQGMYAVSGSHALHVDFVNANHIQPQTETASNSGPAQGKAAPLRRVTYAGLWPGISLDYSASGESIYTTSYSLIPGADAGQIQLRYNAPVTLSPNGMLSLAFKTGEMTESAPVAWQNINGKRVPVEVSFRVDGQQVGFALGAYDPRYTLTIDPSLTWHTFLGGNDADIGTAIAVDGSGNVYVIGYSGSSWGATPIRAFGGYQDAFVAKLDSSGALLWNTFLGSSGGNDYGNAIVVNGSDVYVTGSSDATWSPGLMVPPVRAHSGGSDAFAARLNSSGALQWNTFLGGTGHDVGNAIAVDGSSNLYVAGNSDATWQGANPPVRAYTAGGFYDAFAARLNSSGALTWNTFLGGSANDRSNGIAVDGSGNRYVAGYGDTTWQGANPPVRAYATGGDAFAARLNGSGVLIWNTFLGGTGDDRAYALTVDGSGNVYIAGYSTAAWGLPVQAYVDRDAFAVRLDSAGGLTWNTFVGGSGDDSGNAIAVDGNGNVYLAGDGNATWGSPARAYTAGYDTFAVRLNNNGALGANTFLGGGGDDTGYGLVVDASQNVYVVGYSNATWGSNPVRSYAGGMYDAFVAKVDLPPSVVSVQRANPNPTSASSVNFTVIFSESVSGVNTVAPFNDFTLTTSGVSGAAISAVSGSGSLYTVTVNTGSGDGTIRLDLPASATIVDLAGYSLTNLPYTGGEVYTITRILPFSDILIMNGGAWNKYDFIGGAYLSGVWTGTAAGCIPALIDYDGDGTKEYSQLCGGAWHFYNKNGTYNKGIWVGNFPGSVPVPGDYNGDGVDDPVLFYAGAWHFFNFATGAYDAANSKWTGTGAGCVPAPLDYNGDGKMKFSLFCGGPWHFFNSDGSYNKGVWIGGSTSNLPAPADYDGNGTEEVVVFASGVWHFFDFVTGAYNGAKSTSTGLPEASAKPAPMDYNQDGSLDFVQYANGTWYFYNPNGSLNKSIATGSPASAVPMTRRFLP